MEQTELNNYYTETVLALGKSLNPWARAHWTVDWDINWILETFTSCFYLEPQTCKSGKYKFKDSLSHHALFAFTTTIIGFGFDSTTARSSLYTLSAMSCNPSTFSC